MHYSEMGYFAAPPSIYDICGIVTESILQTFLMQNLNWEQFGTNSFLIVLVAFEMSVETDCC